MAITRDPVKVLEEMCQWSAVLPGQRDALQLAIAALQREQPKKYHDGPGCVDGQCACGHCECEHGAREGHWGGVANCAQCDCTKFRSEPS